MGFYRIKGAEDLSPVVGFGLGVVENGKNQNFIGTIDKKNQNPMLTIFDAGCTSISIFDCLKKRKTQLNCIEYDARMSFMFLILFWIPILVGICILYVTNKYN